MLCPLQPFPAAPLTAHHHGAPAQRALGLGQVGEVVVAPRPHARAVKQAHHQQAAHQVGPPGDEQQAEGAQQGNAAWLACSARNEGGQRGTPGAAASARLWLIQAPTEFLPSSPSSQATSE